MGNQIETKVNPGDIVPGGFSHPNNATVSGDFLYLRDENGNQIAGRTVSDGDRITVLKVLSDKKLALIQYPAGSSVREGYVTNVVSIIKYDNLEKWVNGSTPEYVYETETSSEKIGSLDPREKATVLFKKGNRYNLVYNTSAGVRSKSGFVDYAGGSNSGSGSSDIKPGEIVPGGFTYKNNAIVENDSLYLRDENGNQIAGREVSVGDRITVLDISYGKQLALIQYQTSAGVRQGYVTNTTNIIRYLDEYNWYNGSTSETVYLNSTGNEVFGTLDAYESATKLYEKDGRVHVVYDTPKGMLTKSGYVNFGGLAVPPIGNVTIPSISASGVERIQYGTSGKGRALNAFKIGNGSKIMFAGFAIHGFEDNWRYDGEALVKIATELVYKFSNYNGSNGLHGWTVYIAQCMNPDGVVEGRTNNGPGRCAVTTKIDMNRCFPYSFVQRTNSREYTGKTPLGAPEAVALKNFVQGLNRQASEMVVLDFHGWMTFSQGNSEIGRYFGNQFGFGHNGGYSAGFFSSWASTLKNTKATLIEYPSSTRSYQDVLNGNYIGKTFNAMLNIMKNNPGGGSGGDGGSGNGNGDYDNNSEYHRMLKVTTPLMRGEDVKKVQKKLNDLGYNAGTVDGVYGYGTEAAVIRFQKDKDLLVDGRVGGDTWNKLMNSFSSGNLDEYDNNSEYHRVLKLTTPLMRGEDVKRIQNRLNNLGYNIGLVDGFYGYATEGGVIKFQQTTGLVADGFVGVETWKNLTKDSDLIPQKEKINKKQFDELVKEVGKYFGFVHSADWQSKMVQGSIGSPKFLITIMLELSEYIDPNASMNTGGIKLYENGDFVNVSAGEFSPEIIANLKTKELNVAAKLWGGDVYVKVLSDLSVKIEFYRDWYDDEQLKFTGCLAFIVHFRRLPDQPPLNIAIIDAIEFSNSKALTWQTKKTLNVIAGTLAVATIGYMAVYLGAPAIAIGAVSKVAEMNKSFILSTVK